MTKLPETLAVALETSRTLPPSRLVKLSVAPTVRLFQTSNSPVLSKAARSNDPPRWLNAPALATCGRDALPPDMLKAFPLKLLSTEA